MADHLFVRGVTEAIEFQSSLRVIPPDPPIRNRAAHGALLLGQIGTLERREAQLAAERLKLQLPELEGTLVTLQLAEGVIDISKLEWTREGIKVVKSLLRDGYEYVSVFVPAGKLSAFKSRVMDYLQKDTKGTKNAPPAPRHARLIASISAMAGTVFEDLWTQGRSVPPPDQTRVYQIWLRLADETPNVVIERFKVSAERVGLQVIPGYLRFPERIIVAVHCTRQDIERSLELLDLVAEIRDTSATAEHFIAELKPFEQAQYVQELLSRTTYANPDTATYVTLLDTGTNQHPLLRGMLAAEDLHAVRNEWLTSDHHGHGTAMAGISTFGNMVEPLTSDEPIAIPHRLESVKILPPRGSNSVHLYGWVTERATRSVEERSVDRRRVFAMAISCEGDTMGFPSDWSATIDRLACGYRDTDATLEVLDWELTPERPPRLFSISAGNVQMPDWGSYPQSNALMGVEDPGQAWNALTVGAYTELVAIDAQKWPGRTPIANRGGLAPSSRTSLTWTSWPLKPEVVAEGGNGSSHAMNDGDLMDGPESLRLVTLGHDLSQSSLAETGDTSAANAEAARLCAHTAARYPNYWPETVRALVVHGARWTEAMTADLPRNWRMQDKHNLLRRYGYGAIDHRRTLESGAKRTTLVLQESIQPYRKGSGGSAKLGDMNLHELPWPEDELLALGEARVSLRVTLSYFVEPNPAQRGWRSRFRYQSHGLRFAVKGATEDAEQFLQRVNQAEREETEGAEVFADPDSGEWLIGSRVRSRGSIHSDVWTGTAARIAQKSHIAVFPVGGWWKDTGQHERTARYSLIVSIDAEAVTNTPVDLYTPVATTIAATVAEVPIER